MRTLRKIVGVSAIASVSLFGITACSDEDGDGATTDEEVNELDETVEDGADAGERELQEGRDEVEDGDQMIDDDR